VESLLQSDMLAPGYYLYLNPAAGTHVLNMTRISSFRAEQFPGARAYAAYRARYGGWPVWRRLSYVAGGALIPLVRLRRVLQQIRRCGRQAELLPRILPLLAIGLVSSGLGEVLGYAFEAGTAVERKSELESHRERHLLSHRRAKGSS
jgi:hypothetical protein